MSLTVREAASLLVSTERQIYRWIHEAEIPFERVREQVRFNRTDLLEWATIRRLPVSVAAFDAYFDDPDDSPPSLMQALRVGGAHHGVPANSRSATLEAIIGLTPLPATLDRAFLREVMTARENALSTAPGDGIAIPHVRHPVVAPGAPPAVSVSYLRNAVGFGAPVEVQIRTILLIVSPTVAAHLQMVARVARAILDPGFRAAVLRRAATEDLASEARRLEEAPVAALPAPRSEGAD